MAEYDNNLSGVLFPNKSENPKAPDFTGKATVDDVDYRIVAWKSVSNAGKAYLRIKFETEADREAALAAAEDADALEL